ncbi:MAG: protein kinase domain-containing protein [Gemmatimonadaceae bacterium]
MTDTTSALDKLNTALADRYLIEREIGQGGMATVYLAQDIRHRRKVAIKVLHPELTAVLGPERFLNEIELTANLQHPHILPLFDSGAADTLLFYVMPYVQGETLRTRLSREQQLPIAEAVRIAGDVADALEYAHKHGVVHRDIKPENILLHDGRPLVADFGIALAVQQAGGARMTQTGMSLGTPQYMAPEQAMGDKSVDHRADIYALGAITYEMLTGEPPFTGPNSQAVVAKILTTDPSSLVSKRRSVPPHVEAAVLTALEKMPADRFASAAEFADAIAGRGPVLPTRATAGAPAFSAKPSSRQRALTAAPWALAAVALLMGAWGWLRNEPSVPAPVARFSITPSEAARFVDLQGSGIAVSPDGARFVYTGVNSAGVSQLFMRALGQLEPVAIPGTRGAVVPFFSPDGMWIGFATLGRLQKVALSGGPPLTIAALDSGFFGASWGDKGIVVFATENGLRQVPAAGGKPAPLLQLDTVGGVTSYRFPHFLPGGDALLFQVTSGLNIFAPAAVTLGDRRVIKFEIPGGDPRYVSSGHVVLSNSDGTVTAAPFDPRSLEFRGNAVPIAEQVAVGLGGAAEFGISLRGTYVYASGTAATRAVVAVERGGSVRELTTEMRTYSAPRLSPDGTRVVVEIAEGGTSSIWVYEVAQKTLTKLTVTGSAARPVWTPDGSRITYTADVNGTPDIGWIRADGSALAEPLLAMPGRQLADEWSPDGKSLLYHQNNASVSRNDIMLMSADSGRAVRPYLQTPNDEFAPAISPDGRWLAYTSDESGRNEIYVRSFPEPGGKVQISLDGGNEARWSRSGGELFYRNGDRMMAARVVTAPAFSVQNRTELFRGSFTTLPFHAQYDVTRDGRFIMTQGPASSAALVVVLNWFDQLRGEGRARQQSGGQ